MNPYALIPLACFTALLVVGTYTYARNPRSAESRSFLLLAVFCSYWTFVEFGYRISVSEAQAEFWARVGSFRTLAVPLVSLFIFTYTRVLEGRRALFAALFVFPAVVFAVCDLVNLGVSGLPVRYYWGWGLGTPAAPFVKYAYVVWANVCAALLLWAEVNYYLRGKERDVRERRVFFFSMVGLTVFGMAAFLLDRFVPQVPETTTLVGALLVVFFAYLVNHMGLFAVTPQTAAEEILAVMPHCVALAGATGEIHRVNNALLSLGGYSAEQVRGLRLEDLFEGRVADAQPPTETGFREIRTTFITARGEKIPFEYRAAPIRSKDATTVGWVLVGRDLVRQRRTEEELGRAQRLKSLEVIAGSVAHDFNNLLTSISANLSLARSAQRAVEKDEMVALAEKAAFAAAGLTRQLMNFAVEQPPRKEVCAVTEIIEEAAALSLRGTGVAVEISLEEAIGSVEADRRQMLQVLMNILINSREAMGGGGKVRIGARTVHSRAPDSSDRVEIQIEDFGPGIAEEVIDNIFDPFYTTKSSGCGLGLSIAESIVKRHDGSIAVKSKPGAGTLFTIHLPAAVGSPVAATSGPAAPRSRSGRILVMDDDDMVRQALSHTLTRMGFEVVQARDGAEAVELYLHSRAQDRSFHSLILDLTVSHGYGGKEIISRLREIDPDVRAIIASGYSQDDVVVRHRDYGFIGALTKPFTIGELGKVIDQLP